MPESVCIACPRCCLADSLTSPLASSFSGGLALNFLVAIDFTASNRDPRDPSSLHYIGGRTMYEGEYA